MRKKYPDTDRTKLVCREETPSFGGTKGPR